MTSAFCFDESNFGISFLQFIGKRHRLRKVDHVIVFRMEKKDRAFKISNPGNGRAFYNKVTKSWNLAFEDIHCGTQPFSNVISSSKGNTALNPRITFRY